MEEGPARGKELRGWADGDRTEAQLWMEAKEGVLPTGRWSGEGAGVGTLRARQTQSVLYPPQALQTSMTGAYWGSGTVSWLCWLRIQRWSHPS